MELMLRSLFRRHPAGVNLSVTVFDNASEDDKTHLRAFAEGKQVPIVESGFTTRTAHNSHGEILSRFVLTHPDCTHYLILDPDVCFVEDNTLDVMLAELEQRDDAFGIGPKWSWDGNEEIPERIWQGNPDIYQARLHPCCALIKNTPLFRRVVKDIGLSGVKYLWANGEEYLDTFKLMSRIMGTHGLKHVISAKMVIHFSCVSYDWDPDQVREVKTQRRDRLLQELRK
jgi:hypothetical protein